MPPANKGSTFTVVGTSGIIYASLNVAELAFGGSQKASTSSSGKTNTLIQTLQLNSQQASPNLTRNLQVPSPRMQTPEGLLQSKLIPSQSFLVSSHLIQNQSQTKTTQIKSLKDSSSFSLISNAAPASYLNVARRMYPRLRLHAETLKEFELVDTGIVALSGPSPPMIQTALSRPVQTVESAVGIDLNRNFIKILFTNILAWVGCEWLPKANRRTLN